MARSDFGPEVKQAMNDSGDAPPRSQKLPSAKPPGMPSRNPVQAPPMAQQHQPASPIPAGAPDAHHVAAAASIAHAILGHRGMV